MYSAGLSGRLGTLVGLGQAFLQLLDQDLPHLLIAEPGEQFIDVVLGFGLQRFNRRGGRGGFFFGGGPCGKADQNQAGDEHPATDKGDRRR